MMSNNKILTVSYGTFSCTLEGFDDSFGTMKAIAEYFRDLAADDRYFGAEPPQPDADMLARIAQKEVSRRVQAHERDGQIVLSALEEKQPEPTSAAAPAAATAVAATAAAVAAEQVAPDAPVAAPAEPEVEAEAPAADVAPEKTASQPVTEQAQDEATPDQIVEEAEADQTADLAPTAQEPLMADEATADDIEEDDYTDDTPLTAEISPEDDDEIDIVPGQPDAEVEAFFADTPFEDRPDDLFEDDTVASDNSQSAPLVLVASNDTANAPKPAEAAGGSIADKLERIRAVVARQNDDTEDGDFLEDEHADLGATAPATADETDEEDVVAQARADIEGALDADDIAATDSSADQAEEDELTAMLSRLDGDETQDTDDAADTATLDAQADEAIDSALENMFEDDAAGDSDTQSDTAEEAASPRARVIKVKRADLEAAIEKGDLEEYEDDAAPALDDIAPAKTAESSLSAEDEADLMRDLAALEIDSASEEMPDAQELEAEDVDQAFEDAISAEVQELDGDAQEVAQDEAPSDDDEKAAGSKVLPSIDGEESDDVNRLLAETASQMDEPESATRRDAFAHLRAAVAARKADGTMEADDAAAKDANAYRSDLANVVRPRRPEAPAEGLRTERPEGTSAAPLKLVAEQRIDLGNPHTSGPVSPRRVSGLADNAAAETNENESFAAYAAEMGVDKLPELLEAAASYMSFVEGREEFSRPQLMTKVRQAGPSGDFSREDGLRSFGQLLRSGKISKIKGGRFTVSDDIGYRPSEREAG